MARVLLSEKPYTEKELEILRCADNRSIVWTEVVARKTGEEVNKTARKMLMLSKYRLLNRINHIAALTKHKEAVDEACRNTKYFYSITKSGREILEKYG